MYGPPLDKRRAISELRGDETKEPHEDSCDYPPTHLDDQALSGVEPVINLFEPPIDLFEPPIDLFEPAVNRVQAPVDLVETLVDPVESLFQPLVGPVPGHRLHDHRRP